MRSEETGTAKRSEEGLMSALMGLLLVGGVLLSLQAPSQVATSFTEVGRPEAAELRATTPDDASRGETIAAIDRPAYQAN